MTYVLAFIVGLASGYFFEGLKNKISDETFEEGEEEYIQITEKGKQWLESNRTDERF